MKKRILALVLALAMVFALVACGGGGEQGGSTGTPSPATNTGTPSTDAPEASGGGAPTELKVAMTTTMGDMGPFAYSSAGRNALKYTCYECLAVFKEFGQSWREMEWQLAKDIQQIDDNTYQIEIYDYIVDAIGNSVKASDVVFCINEVATNGAYPRITTYLDSVTALDDVTIEIKLKSTLVGALEYLLVQSPIVSEKTYKENESIMSTTPITTAAYQVTECVDGSYYIVTKNENYWQKPELANYYAQQPVDKIKYNIITEGSQATIALQMGEVDMISSVKSSELGYFISDGIVNEGYAVNKCMATTPVSLVFNMSESGGGDLFRDNLALRQAICTAIDQRSIVDVAFSGYAETISDISFSGCGDYNHEWETDDYYDYDLAAAKQLLEEAGYAGGKKDGKQVTIEIIVSSVYSAAAQVVQAQLMELGFNVELLALDDAMFVENMKTHGESTWNISIMKQGTEGYISNIYDNIMLRNKDGMGAKNMIVDDELEALLQAAHDVSTHNTETVDALRYYVKDNAIAYGLAIENIYSVGREGIMPGLYPFGYFCANVSTFDG